MYSGKCFVLFTVGTHSGTFHCDEALGCWLLKQTDEFKDAAVVRTRDQSVLNTLDVIIDVGGEYDPGQFQGDFFKLLYMYLLKCFLKYRKRL